MKPYIYSKLPSKTIILSLSVFLITITSCRLSRSLPDSIGEERNAVNFGYQPLDPLPVKIDNGDQIISNKKIMNSLPDETMRLAIGQIDGKGNISFGPAKLGYAGSSYLVILDYIKFDTKSFALKVAKNDSNEVIDIQALQNANDNADAVIPVYVGVGLRFTATVKVNEGNVDLGNLFALGVAAEAKKVTGTLIIQTLGISGENISPLIPMPSQINTTTIQNAIMALSSIKAKIYEDSAKITPRVVGFYNSLGGGQQTVHKFISSVLSKAIIHPI